MAIGDRPFLEREKHLHLMEEQMLAGRTDREVIAAAVEKFKVSRSTARRDCELIRERWAKHAAGDRDSLITQFGKALLRIEGMYRRAMSIADRAEKDNVAGDCLAALGTALKLEQERLALFGLVPGSPPMKGNLEIPTQREEEEYENGMREIIDQVRKQRGLPPLDERPPPSGPLVFDESKIDPAVKAAREEELALIELPEDVTGPDAIVGTA